MSLRGIFEFRGHTAFWINPKKTCCALLGTTNSSITNQDRTALGFELMKTNILTMFVKKLQSQADFCRVEFRPLLWKPSAFLYVKHEIPTVQVLHDEKEMLLGRTKMMVFKPICWQMGFGMVNFWNQRVTAAYIKNIIILTVLSTFTCIGSDVHA